MTPFEKFTGERPNLSRLEKFGVVCYSYVQNKSKLDKRAIEGTYVGKDPVSPAHLVYLKDKNEVIRVRCVTFSKTCSTLNDSFDEYEPIYMPIISKRFEEDSVEGNQIIRENPGKSGIQPENDLCSVEAPSAPEGVDSEAVEASSGAISKNSNLSKRYPGRQKKAPAYLDDYVVEKDNDFHDASNRCVDYFCKISDIPLTYEQAIVSKDSDSWQKAMEDEMSSLIAMDTFQLAPRPKKKVIGGRWVYSMKTNENHEEIFKARYVAKGFSQVRDIDYNETFSPTARLTSVRVLLQLAVDQNWSIFQLDVKTAYLNADVDFDIYIEQPKGFIKYDHLGNKLVFKLNKSIYGLKQSGRMWYNLLHDFLVEKGFVQSTSDYCVYTRKKGGSKVILIVWVDDIVVAGSTIECANEVKSMLSKRFNMKDFGSISNFLGIQFELEPDVIKMHQTNYAQKILEKFKMVECNAKSTPCDLSTVKIDFDHQSPILEDPGLFREIVGSLIYLMTCTRPDLCYVVTVLSQYMSKPTMAHLNLAKYVLRYIKGTINYGLVFTKSPTIGITGYTDASWANSIDRKSISGFCFKMSPDSALISWKSKKQPIVALSSCESEYVAMAYAIQEISFLQQLTGDMFVFQSPEPVTLYVDNQGAIQLGKNPVYHQRSKHIDTRYHYIRSKISDGSVILEYVPSRDNVADMFTKPCK